MSRRAALLLSVTVTVLLTLLSPAGPASADSAVIPSDTDVDYQLSGPAPVPDNVGIVVRDRRAKPLKDKFNVCYVNAFQTQPEAKRFWRDRWGLVLKRDGKPVVDGAWGEWLLDIRTPAKRERLAKIIGRWARGCANKGFDAVEYDNLDSFLRSKGMIKPRQTAAYARLINATAHRHDLFSAQKNRAGWDGRRAGYDFAVSEECGRFHECRAYTKIYGRDVLVIEYRRKDFRGACKVVGDEVPVVLRDRQVTPDGVRAYC